MVRLSTIGPVSVKVGTKVVAPTNDQVVAALLFLVAERGSPISRRLFAEMFFPAVDAEAQSHSGRQLVYRLRKMGVALSGDAVTITLDADKAEWDVDALLARGFASQAEMVALAHGYMSEYRHHRSEQFARWLDAHRSGVEGKLRADARDRSR